MEQSSTLGVVLLICMATTLALGLITDALRNHAIASEPMIALSIGVLAGPYVLGWADLGQLTDDVPRLMADLARLVLGIAIMAAMLRVGSRWIRRNLRDLALILLLGLPAMWALSFAALQLLLPSSVLATLLLAAVLTPTDPVLAQAVVTSKVAEKNVPENLRHLLSAESAGNDGLAFLFVGICLLALGVAPGSAGLGAGEIANLLLWNIGGAFAIGAAAGWGVGRLKTAAAGGWAGEAGLLAAVPALALVVVTGLEVMGMDGLFGVFGAGIALSATITEEHRARHIGFSRALEEIFQLPFLVLIGMVLPIDGWVRLGWPLAGAVGLVLLFRRLPMVLVLRQWLRSVSDLPSAVFAGWFGPIGVAALFYAAVALERTGSEPIFVIATAMIAGSAFAHGVTDTAASRLLGKARAARDRRCHGSGAL